MILLFKVQKTTWLNLLLAQKLQKKMLLCFDGTKSKFYYFIDNCDNATNLVKLELKMLPINAKTLTRNKDFDNWLNFKHIQQKIMDRKGQSDKEKQNL